MDAGEGRFLTCQVDPDGRLTGWGPGAARLTGFEADEVLGDSFLDLFASRSGDVLRLAREAGWGEGEGWFNCRDASRFWCHFVILAVPAGGEAPLAFACLGHALGEGQGINSGMPDHDADFGLLLKMIPHGLWMSDADGRIQYLSDRFVDYMGCAETDPPGWTETLHPGARMRGNSSFGADGRSDEVYVNEGRIRRPGQSYRWFRAEVIPQRSPEGKVVHWVGTLTDINEQKRRAAERAELLERERQARARAERIARDERALRDAVATVTTRFADENFSRQMAEGAMKAAEARGAAFGVAEEENGQMRVLATAGRLPPIEGSLPLDASHYRGWSVLLLSLAEPTHPHGVLALFRPGDEPPLGNHERARAAAFCKLASLAFEKQQILERAGHRREELARVTESRSLLMRGFSHDLKNPLGAAQGHVHLLEQGIVGEVTDSQREALARIRERLDESLRLIEDLLEHARAEESAGKEDAGA